MPHFLISCSEQIVKLKSPQEIIQKVHDTALSTELFISEEIKIRINPFQYHTIGNTYDNLKHLFANSMEGRTSEQKSHSSIKSFLVSSPCFLKPFYPEKRGSSIILKHK